jgi:hypothetical protein
MRLTHPQWFAVATAAAFILPVAIPNVGIDSEFWIITVFVFLAWFVFRWDAVKGIGHRAAGPESIFGVVLIAVDYAFNWFRGSSVGIIDLLVIFAGTVIAFFGYRSLKIFWVPATYGVVLLFGYEVINLVPSISSLQDWLAGVMASMLNALGIASTVSGR